MWDNDKEPDTEDMDWKDLSADQQKAAEVLGYTQKVNSFSVDMGDARPVPLLTPISFFPIFLLDLGRVLNSEMLCSLLLDTSYVWVRQHTETTWI